MVVNATKVLAHITSRVPGPQGGSDRGPIGQNRHPHSNITAANTQGNALTLHLLRAADTGDDMNIPLTRKTIMTELCVIEWQEVVIEFSDLTHDQIYEIIRKIYRDKAWAERLSSAIYHELNE